ncbi:hypothetical protein [uncultured Marivirga sp.]|uniref:hypothetical protein n=1 Tax=uncultured Marivirga sp. TaxID=1123707 RepID=UPI0030EC3E37|tara:strand:- start:507396 stop:508697 length:1302 start_codon:yes stop_codon:yes gene_type:complete
MKNEIKTAPAWLKRIQEGSWEPEILISGIVLFGLFKIYPLIAELNYFLDNNSFYIFSKTTANDTITSILKFANIVLTLGFVTHLLFRSVWAAFVGLSYVYPKGIDFDKLKYPNRYINHIAKGSDYTAQIIKLEKVCSTLFAISFLIFMWVLGLVFFTGLLIIGLTIVREIVGSSNFQLLFVDDILSIFFVISLIDLVSLGWFKRIPYINKVFYPLYRFTGWITLSFLYRNIYYGLISNHKKWKISVILLLFLLSSTVTLTFLRSKEGHFGRTIALEIKDDSEYRLKEDMYRDKVTDNYYSRYMHIDSYICKDDYLELFVVHTSAYENDFIKPRCNYDSLKQGNSNANDSLRFACLNQFYGVALDGKLLEDDFIYQRNSQTGQDGLLSIVDISNLKSGKHQIDLYYDFFDAEKDTTYHNSVSQLSFYRTSKPKK